MIGPDCPTTFASLFLGVYATNTVQCGYINTLRKRETEVPHNKQFKKSEA